MAIGEVFFGRKENIKAISRFFNSDNNDAALIYGRRRVGKTELIKHCLKQQKQLLSIMNVKKPLS